MAGMFDDLFPGKTSDKPADFGMFADLVPAAPPAAGAIRKLADVGLAGAQGVVSGVKMFSDLAGADNRVSGALESANEGLGSLMSKARQMELSARSKTIDAANASGDTWEQVKAYMGGFAEAPASTIAQGVGSLVPMLPTMLIGGSAAAGGAALRSGAMMGVGAAQGVGAVKGSTFERVRDGLLKDGYQTEEATARATEAQNYLGANSTDMMVAGVIGAVTGRIGVEGAIESIFHGTTKAAGKTLPRVAGGMASEGLTEAAQGGQEQFAGNRALSNAGIETDPMMGVLGAGVLEGTVGAAIGGALAFKKPRLDGESPGQNEQRQQAADQGLADLSSATNADSAVDAFTRATDVPLTVPAGFQDGPALDRLDAIRQRDEQGLRQFGPERPFVAPPMQSSADSPSATGTKPSAEFVPDAPFGDRVLTLREQLADPATREAVRARFGPEGLSQAMYSANAADNTSVNIPDKTRGRMLELAERIVGESILPPINRPVVGGGESALAVGVDQTPDVPRIGLDTRPTGAIRVDSQGSAAPETQADVINTRQPINRPARPDGMTQQVTGRPLPREGVMVGEGTLTAPARRAAAQALQLTTDNKGGMDAGNAGGPGGAPTADPGRSDRVAGVPDSRPADVLERAGSTAGQGVAGPGAAGDGARPVALIPGQRVTLPGKDGAREAWTVDSQTGTILRLDNGKGRMRAVQVGSNTWATIQPEGGAATAQTTISANGGSEAAAGQPAAATSQPTSQADAQPTTTTERDQAPASAATGPAEPAVAAAGSAPLETGGLKPAPVDTFYESLIGKKSTKQVTSAGGRTIFDVEVTPAMRAKHYVNGRFPETAGFALKPKADVTGIPQDRGYVLIDKREQVRQRSSDATDQVQAPDTSGAGAPVEIDAKPEAAPATNKEPLSVAPPARPEARGKAEIGADITDASNRVGAAGKRRNDRSLPNEERAQASAEHDAALDEIDRLVAEAKQASAEAATPVSATEWARELARLSETKPRPLGRLYGANGPTPEQAKAHADQERAWNSAYRKASAEQKKALERDNAAYRAKQSEPDLSQNGQEVDTSAEPAQKTAESEQVEPASNAAAQETQPAPDGETAGPTEAAAPDPFATPEAFDGKTITQQVQVADTGKTATLRMDAGQALRDVNEREAALLKLKACMGR